MYARIITKKIKESLKKYKVVALLGPRQSGKTTIAKIVNPKKIQYFNFEDINTRKRAIEDPVSFVHDINSDVVFDEIQKVPDLISQIQVHIDDSKNKNRFILTGSNSLFLSDKVSQSLAGRVRIFNVLPLQYQEIPQKLRPKNIYQALLTGGFPRIYKEKLDPSDWCSDYLQTYVEKDVRNILNIEDLYSFSKFLKLLAGRVGQLLSFSSLANEVGVSQPTIKKWISVLEASFVVFILQPHFQNFNKRITKSAKLYFVDTGLVCQLLNISSEEQIHNHPLRGMLFENWVVIEKMKMVFHSGKKSPFYFWRDQHGHEVDLVEDIAGRLDLTEIKMSMTFREDFFEQIDWLNNLQKYDKGQLVYAGNESFKFKNFTVKSWKDI